MRLCHIFTTGLVGLLISVSSSPGQDTVLQTGNQAPDFKATATNGDEVTLNSFKGADVLVVVFTCNGCPVAKAYEDRLIQLSKEYGDKNVQLVAINNHQSEDVAAMKSRSEEKDFPFVYAYEGSGDSARAYGAKVTPHCFVFDKDRKLVYQGAFDDSQTAPKANYVADAVDAALTGKTVDVSIRKAFGCGIKMRASK